MLFDTYLKITAKNLLLNWVSNDSIRDSTKPFTLLDTPHNHFIIIPNPSKFCYAVHQTVSHSLWLLKMLSVAEQLFFSVFNSKSISLN